MNKKLWIWVLALLPLCLAAQGQELADADKGGKGQHHVFTGFSGGMMLHGGYLFSDSPEKVFSNTGLGSEDYVKGLPQSGFCYGLGGSLRAHLVNHVHLGAEGFVSTMPIMRTGSNIRTGWGGVLCDGYMNLGKFRPLLGLTIGGGSMKRLFVPDQDKNVYYYTAPDSTRYNASYTKTPFFFIDPYIGFEVDLNAHMALMIRIDYMLPFGKSQSELVESIKASNWKNTLMTPTGPRLYVGIMFGQLNRNKKETKQ